MVWTQAQQSIPSSRPGLVDLHNETTIAAATSTNISLDLRPNTVGFYARSVDVQFYADKACTLTWKWSTDGSTYFTIDSTDIGAGETWMSQLQAATPYMRFVITTPSTNTAVKYQFITSSGGVGGGSQVAELLGDALEDDSNFIFVE